MPEWWAKGNDPTAGDPASQEQANSDSLSQKLRDGMGIGFTTIAEGGLYPFMLSSVFTARNYGVNDKEEVEWDIVISFVLSVVVAVVIGYYLHSNLTILWGILFGGLLSVIYMFRSGFWTLPIHIPVLMPKGAP